MTTQVVVKWFLQNKILQLTLLLKCNRHANVNIGETLDSSKGSRKLLWIFKRNMGGSQGLILRSTSLVTRICSILQPCNTGVYTVPIEINPISHYCEIMTFILIYKNNNLLIKFLLVNTHSWRSKCRLKEVMRHSLINILDVCK